MKVWQKIAELKSGQMGLEQVEAMLSAESNCAAYHECDYRLAPKKLLNFCKHGCSVDCLREYLNFKIEGGM